MPLGNESGGVLGVHRRLHAGRAANPTGPAASGMASRRCALFGHAAVRQLFLSTMKISQKTRIGSNVVKV